MALCVALRWRKIVVLKTATCVTRADANRHHASCRSTRQPTTSLVTPFELLHEIREYGNPLFGECIVDGRAYPTHRPMPLEAVEPGRAGLLDELFLQVFARQTERHIHQGSAVFLRGAAIETRAVYLVVQRPRLPFVQLRRLREPSLVDQPACDKAEDVNREHGRRVVHRSVFGVY